MSVLKYDPDGLAAHAYRQLAKEVLKCQNASARAYAKGLWLPSSARPPRTALRPSGRQAEESRQEGRACGGAKVGCSGGQRTAAASERLKRPKPRRPRRRRIRRCPTPQPALGGGGACRSRPPGATAPRLLTRHSPTTSWSAPRPAATAGHGGGRGRVCAQRPAERRVRATAPGGQPGDPRGGRGRGWRRRCEPDDRGSRNREASTSSAINTDLQSLQQCAAAETLHIGDSVTRGSGLRLQSRAGAGRRLAGSTTASRRCCAARTWCSSPPVPAAAPVQAPPPWWPRSPARSAR